MAVAILTVDPQLRRAVEGAGVAVALTANNKLHPFFLPFTIKPALGAMEDHQSLQGAHIPG
jgi:hypothetical protein